jgi:phosphatidylglycerophosphatase A
LGLLLGVPLMQGPAWLLPVLCVTASLGGVWVVSRVHAGDDPGWVVIDEVAGQWIALLGLRHPTFWGMLAAFALFRLFDIVKPGPVGWADRQGGAASVMADDVIAGAFAALLILAARHLWPGLPL